MGGIKNERINNKYGRTLLRHLRWLRSVRPRCKLCEKIFNFDVYQQTSIHTFWDTTDPDDLDRHSVHALIEDGNRLASYARIIRPLRPEEPVRIGRVVTAPPYRRRGLARRLMHEVLAYIGRQWPGRPVEISAQTYLVPFYESLGFRILGEEYLEDGIPHIRMIYTKN